MLIGVIGRCQKMSKFDIQSQFSTSKIIRNFLIFFSLKNISLGECVLLLSNFENFNIWTTLFSKMVPNFLRSVWPSVKVKSKKYFSFTDLFAKIYSLLTHVRKTPPLRSHYLTSSIIALNVVNSRVMKNNNSIWNRRW